MLAVAVVTSGSNSSIIESTLATSCSFIGSIVKDVGVVMAYDKFDKDAHDRTDLNVDHQLMIWNLAPHCFHPLGRTMWQSWD